MYGLTNEELNTIVEILRKALVKKAVLFGSRAKETHKNGSDVDIAVIGDEKKVSYLLNEETNLPYFFDVINIEEIVSQNLNPSSTKILKKLLKIK